MSSKKCCTDSSLCPKLRRSLEVKLEIPLKDWILIGVGVAFVVLIGLAIYGVPPDQIFNEISGLWSLRKRYERGDFVHLKAGTELWPTDPSKMVLTLEKKTTMSIWNDDGMGWYETETGKKRARIIHVYRPSSMGPSIIYEACHHDLA